MKTKSLMTAFTLAVLSIFGFHVHAQWTPVADVNTLVSDVETSDIQSIGTSDGKTFVVSWVTVPAPQNYEIRVQLLDENGFQLFGPNGMVVNNTVPMSTYTTLWSVNVDKDDNLFVCFNGTGAGNPAYVHKISTAGVQLWGNNGIVVGAGYDVKVLPMSNGNVVVGWLPGNQGVIQLYNALGTPVWANSVTVTPTVGTHKTSVGEMAELSEGRFVVCFHDRGGFSPSSFFYAQKYDNQGTAMWPSPVQLSNISTVFNRRYTLVQDMDTLYLGYSASPGTDFQSYLQRINPDGTLPWGINGSDFSTLNNYYEMDTKAAYSHGSPYVWTICEFMTSSQGESGEYVQKFDKVTGARMFTNGGKEVFPVTADMESHVGDLRLLSDQPFFVVSKGYNNGATPLDFRATQLDANGDFLWPDSIHEVGTSLENKYRVNFTKPVNGQSVCVWVEDRDSIGGYRAFAQNVQGSDCPLPVAAFSYSATGLTVNFTSSSLNADSTIWVFADNGTIAYGNTAQHIYASEGTYQVCLIVINDCGIDTICQTITVVIIGIPDINENAHVSIYPNPGTGQILDFQLNQESDLTFSIHSLAGQKLFEQMGRYSQGSVKVNLGELNLTPGLYFLHYSVNGKKGNQRFVVIE